MRSALSAALSLLLPLFVQETRQPIPDPNAVKDSEKLVRDLFKEDYARKDAPARRALSEKLLKQAEETREDAPARFALLREARELAALAGDVDLAFKVADELARHFAVDALELKRATLAFLEKTSRTVEESRRLAAAHLALGGASLAGDALEAAEESFQSAGVWGKKAKELSLVTRAETLVKEVRDLRARLSAVAAAEKVLASNPEDPAANATVGQYRCFKGDWAGGLPFLAKGPEGLIREAATRDLAEPADASSRVGMGDLWWSASEKETGTARQQLRTRAANWYAKALPDLTGLSKAKVEKRLSEVKPQDPKPGAAPAKMPRGGLVAEWLFEEGKGTAVASTAGRGNEGTLVGSVEWAEGRAGKALRFNGSGYVFCKVSGLPAANASQTISWWHSYASYPPSPQSIITISDGGPSSAVQPGLKGGHVAIWKFGGEVLVSSTPPTAGEWHHYAYVFDGKRHALYIDGAMGASSEAASQAGTATRCEFGRWWGDGGNSYFNGSLDQVRIYSRALSVAEVQALAGE